MKYILMQLLRSTRLIVIRFKQNVVSIRNAVSFLLSLIVSHQYR